MFCQVTFLFIENIQRFAADVCSHAAPIEGLSLNTLVTLKVEKSLICLVDTQRLTLIRNKASQIVNNSALIIITRGVRLNESIIAYLFKLSLYAFQLIKVRLFPRTRTQKFKTNRSIIL